MQRAFDLLEERANVVEIEPRPKSQVAHIPLHGSAGGGGRAGEPATQRVVDDVAKRSARLPRQPLELGSDILIEGQRRAHIMMLVTRLMMSMSVRSG